MPYLGPSRVVLHRVHDLIRWRRWTLPPKPRDKSNDMTDEQISKLL